MCGAGGENGRKLIKSRKYIVGCKPTKDIKKCDVFQRGKKILKRTVEHENPIWGERDDSSPKVAQFRSSEKKSKTKQASTLDYDAIQMPKDVQDRTSIYIMLPLDQVSIDGVLQVSFVTTKKSEQAGGGEKSADSNSHCDSSVSVCVCVCVYFISESKSARICVSDPQTNWMRRHNG